MAGNPLHRLRRSALALPLAVLVALAVVVINEIGYGNARHAALMLAEHNVARTALQTLLTSLVDAETSQRGYLLTERSAYMKPYEDAVAKATQSLEQLRRYYAVEPQLLATLQALDSAADAKLSEIATTLRLHAEGRHEQWQTLFATDIGREKMEEVRSAIGRLLEHENGRIERQRTALLDTLAANRIGVNVMAALALLVLVLFLRQTAALDRAQRDHAMALRAERDQLEAEVERRTADLTELAQHLQTAREDERSLLARELHDELGALLTGAKLDAARLKRSLGSMSPEVEDRFKRLNAMIDQGIQLKRRIIENLRPSSLSNLGLVAALEIQAAEFAKRTEIRVQTSLEDVALGDAAQISVYRLVQEALTNIAKYARARQVTIRLENRDARVHVQVQDDGVGFDPARTPRSSHGLLGMRYRMQAQGGELRVRSAPGAGATIEAWLPQQQPPAAADEAAAPPAATPVR